jgi:hypothetical protein
MAFDFRRKLTALEFLAVGDYRDRSADLPRIRDQYRAIDVAGKLPSAGLAP